jgi:hypothetical protein
LFGEPERVKRHSRDGNEDAAGEAVMETGSAIAPYLNLTVSLRVFNSGLGIHPPAEDGQF